MVTSVWSQVVLVDLMRQQYEWKERLTSAISKSLPVCDSGCTGAQWGGEALIGCENCFPSFQSQMTAVLSPPARCYGLNMTVELFRQEQRVRRNQKVRRVFSGFLHFQDQFCS